ncbi:MAG: MBL fold metallo-hydrolase [Arcanobacterium sp.]|nr:MBL fold metallo-hydrolase [Arcanobacterium sp.]
MIFLRYGQTFMDSNTYVIADEHNREALVVDTGAGSAQWIRNMLATRGLKLGAVLLTHGHADHVWDVSAVAGEAPVYIAAPDMYRLEDPLQHLGMPELALGFSRMGIDRWAKPQNLQEIPPHAFTTSFEIVAGIWIRALSTPGHTEGSCIFLLEGEVAQTDDPDSIPTSGRRETYMLSGDVLFAGSIGRTDLPGGDNDEMVASLRLLVNVIHPSVQIYPGHGPQTNMFHETRHNEYLHAAMS